jgi:hypothetical protein
MSFLQPAMLFALPLIALPIIIHLINQRRFRTIQWGAMMFLLAANRMSRGYARIRQWLILAARTLAIAGLLLAVSRPLASGWLGLAAGGTVDTTIILLDRSPSMLEQGAGGMSKLDAGRNQLIRSLGLLGSNRWVLIDSANVAPLEIASVDELAELEQTQGVSASADLPAMLQAAYEYIRENRPSRTDVWICSDVRQHDWDPDSGRWQVIRDAFLELPQPVRFHLLAYPEASAENRAIRVTDVRRRETSTGAELLLSLRVEQTAAAEGGATVPIQLEIDGARSEISAELIGGEVELKDHAVPLDGRQTQGWGRVSIPADANAGDNEFFFVYDQPAPRKTIIVADDRDAVRPLQLAAAISPDPSIESTVEIVEPDQVTGTDWDGASLVLWQAQLPQDALAAQVQSFLARGGQIIFFPPVSPADNEFAGVRWEDWQEPNEEVPVSGWTGDQDLLANTRSGAALPVGELRIARYCELAGDYTPLATLAGGGPLLCRAVTEAASEGADLSGSILDPRVYFCATTADERDSSLARDGIVLYVFVQRALTAGAEARGTAQQFVAGKIPAGSTSQWQLLSDNEDAIPTVYGVLAGVYRHGEKLFAVNRSDQEDRRAVVPDARVAGLFQQLDFNRINDQAGSGTSLLAEIWRVFLAIMMAALLMEAFLCVPRRTGQGNSTSGPPVAANS